MADCECLKMRKSDKSRRRKNKMQKERKKYNSRLNTRKRSEYKILKRSTVLVENELSRVLLNVIAEVQSMRTKGMM